ncbi:MAG: hypothetical protein QXU32_09250 [Nitrososphaerales archaeon]
MEADEGNKDFIHNSQTEEVRHASSGQLGTAIMMRLAWRRQIVIEYEKVRNIAIPLHYTNIRVYLGSSWNFRVLTKIRE